MKHTFFKKNSSLRKDNDFSEKSRQLFWECYACSACGMNGWDCGHHIINKGKFIDSPLNLAPLHNSRCHIGKSLHDFETRLSFLQKTWEYLKSISYKLTEKDKSFIRDNWDYFKNFIDIKFIINNKPMQDEEKLEPEGDQEAETEEVSNNEEDPGDSDEDKAAIAIKVEIFLNQKNIKEK